MSLTDEQLTEVEQRSKDYLAHGVGGVHYANLSAGDVPALLAEVRRQHAELAVLRDRVDGDAWERLTAQLKRLEGARDRVVALCREATQTRVMVSHDGDRGVWTLDPAAVEAAFDAHQPSPDGSHCTTCEQCACCTDGTGDTESTEQPEPVVPRCANVSFYRRPCTLPPHGWQQACEFAADPDGDEFDLTSTIFRDMLEAVTAGGATGVAAAIRWVECRLYRRAEEAREYHLGDQLVSEREGALEVVRDELAILLGYLTRRAEEGALGSGEGQEARA